MRQEHLPNSHEVPLEAIVLCLLAVALVTIPILRISPDWGLIFLIGMTSVVGVFAALFEWGGGE